MMKYLLNRSRVLLGFFFLLFCTTVSNSQRVKPISEKELDSLISKRNGTILLLNIWATWCVPCKEEFPDLIKLSKDYKKKKIQFIAISVDYPDEIKEKIIPVLDSLHIPFTVYVADFQSQDSLINKLNKKWTGAVPATFIYDRRGKQRKFLFGKQTYRQLKNAIDEVLKKPYIDKK